MASARSRTRRSNARSRQRARPLGRQHHARVIGAVVAAAPRLLERHFAPNSCMQASRLTVEALRSAGLRAEPFQVSVMASNPAMTACLQANPSATHKEIIGWERSHGAWSVGIGDDQLIVGPNAATPPSGFNGHVVALVERRYVVDLTLGQISRPQFDMWFGPTCFEVDRDWLSGTRGVIEVNGSLVKYTAHPHERSFLRTSAWSDPQVPSLVRELARQVTVALADAA